MINLDLGSSLKYLAPSEKLLSKKNEDEKKLVQDINLVWKKIFEYLDPIEIRTMREVSKNLERFYWEIKIGPLIQYMAKKFRKQVELINHFDPSFIEGNGLEKNNDKNFEIDSNASPLISRGFVNYWTNHALIYRSGFWEEAIKIMEESISVLINLEELNKLHDFPNSYLKHGVQLFNTYHYLYTLINKSDISENYLDVARNLIMNNQSTNSLIMNNQSINSLSSLYGNFFRIKSIFIGHVFFKCLRDDTSLQEKEYLIKYLKKGFPPMSDHMESLCFRNQYSKNLPAYLIRKYGEIEKIGNIRYRHGLNMFEKVNLQEYFLKFCDLLYSLLEKDLDKMISIICKIPRTCERIVEIIPRYSINKPDHLQQILQSECNQLKKPIYSESDDEVIALHAIKDRQSFVRLKDLELIEIDKKLIEEVQVACLEVIVEDPFSSLKDKDIMKRVPIEHHYYLAQRIARRIGLNIFKYIEKFTLSNDEKNNVYKTALELGDSLNDYGSKKMWIGMKKFGLDVTQDQILSFSKIIFEKTRFHQGTYCSYIAFRKHSHICLNEAHEIELADFLALNDPSTFALFFNRLDIKRHFAIPGERGRFDHDRLDPYLTSLFINMAGQIGKNTFQCSDKLKSRLIGLINEHFAHKPECKQELLDEVERIQKATAKSKISVKSARNCSLTNETVQESEEVQAGMKRGRDFPAEEPRAKKNRNPN